MASPREISNFSVVFEPIPNSTLCRRIFLLNTTTSFHQLKNMWNLSRIFTDFEKSDNLKFEPNSIDFEWWFRVESVVMAQTPQKNLKFHEAKVFWWFAHKKVQDWWLENMKINFFLVQGVLSRKLVLIGRLIGHIFHTSELIFRDSSDIFCKG